MAGYVFAIGNDADPHEVIRKCAETGTYSTYMSTLAPTPFEGTMADFISMHPGDNVYFFCKRKYYGIGELISVGPDCKYCNFPGASALSRVHYDDIRNDLLLDYGEDSPCYRWLCTFKGSPYFFEEGIDTDEILAYKPSTFKMLRAFWKVSFIKLSEEENASLREIFLLRRQNETREGIRVLPEGIDTHHTMMTKDLTNYLITPTDLLRTTTVNNKVKHEMALEATIVYDLCHQRIPI